MATTSERVITLRDLKDQTGTNGPRPLLRCDVCGTESSANRADYFTVSPDYVFTCCGEPMALVTKHTVYRKVKVLR